MNIKEFKQWWNRFEYSGNFPEPKAEHINLLLAEVDRLTAELKEREGECERRGKELLAIHKALKDNVNDPDPLPSSPYCASYPTTYGLVMGITRERDKWKSLAASRLADQEYKKVIDDALVVANIGAATGDAKADVHKLICWEIDVALDPRVSKRAADLIAEREADVDKLTHERDLWENMAAMRLADQEAIERHVTKRVAGECADFLVNYDMNNFPGSLTSGISLREWLALAIRQKYGVE